MNGNEGWDWGTSNDIKWHHPNCDRRRGLTEFSGHSDASLVPGLIRLIRPLRKWRDSAHGDFESRILECWLRCCLKNWTMICLLEMAIWCHLMSFVELFVFVISSGQTIANPVTNHPASMICWRKKFRGNPLAPTQWTTVYWDRGLWSPGRFCSSYGTFFWRVP